MQTDTESKQIAEKDPLPDKITELTRLLANHSEQLEEVQGLYDYQMAINDGLNA